MRAGGPIASLCAEWPKASLLCGTQATRVRIDGGGNIELALVMLKGVLQLYYPLQFGLICETDVK